MATLIVMQGPDKGRTMRTTDDLVLIGRGSSQVPLTDQTVSRRHAQLARQDAGWELSDLNSANGTYLNGVRLQHASRLKRGDQIRVGSTLMLYAGDDSVQQYAGGAIPTDLVTLDVGNLDAAVVASVPSSDDSIVLAAPETAYAVKGWNVMRELSDVTSRLLPVDQLLGRVLDIIFEEVEVDRGVIFVQDESTNELLPEVVRFRGSQRGDEEGEEHGIIASRTIINHVVAAQEGVLCTNVVADQRFRSGKSVQNLGLRSVICAPIVARQQVLGVIHLDCPITRHTYNEYELRLITSIAFQAGLAVENARLVQSQLERERLAAAGETVAYLSHYIKNILQGMRSGADIVDKGLNRRDIVLTASGWRIVEKNLERSYNLMLNMLAFSKEREPRLQTMQLNKIVEEAVELVQRQVDDKQIVLLTDLDDQLPPVPLDYDGMHQVTLNILTNAIDAVERHSGVVSARTGYDDRHHEAVLTIRDNGPGVPPERRERIFQPFDSSKGQGGTGLGLAAAFKIVNEMGGAITVHDAPDGGAEFQVRLPGEPRRGHKKGDTLGS